MKLDRDSTAPLAAFVVGTVLAGGNAVGVRVSNRELDPLWGAGLRFLLAACLLGAVMAVMRLALPRGRALLGVLLYGVLIFGGAFSFAYYALVRIHAGLGQTLLALVPLATLLLAVLQGQERLRLAAVVGTLFSVAGIAVISGVSGSESVPALSLLAVLGAVLCFAQATVLFRRFPQVHPVTTNALGMAAGAVLLVALALLLDDSIALPERAGTWLALAYMVVLGSGPVFVLYLVVVRLWSASRAAYTFVVIPIVTVLLSAWIDDEPIGAGLVLGGLLVLAGVYVGALRPAATPALQTQIQERSASRS
jgi:drug/metabolite transporter (DMT)-like permease